MATANCSSSNELMGDVGRGWDVIGCEEKHMQCEQERRKRERRENEGNPIILHPMHALLLFLTGLIRL